MRLFRAMLPLCAVATLAGCGSTSPTANTPVAATTTTTSNLQLFANGTGSVATYTTAASFDLNNAFFHTLGANGRTCGTCHQQGQGMSLSAAGARALFTSSGGTDPLFLAVDGANCPTAAAGDATARSLLLNFGLIRVSVALPRTAQFRLTVLSDPYGCATPTTNAAGQQVVSVYRRPLPSTSLNYLSEVMWDSRDTTAALGAAANFVANLNTDLTQQAVEAVANHAQGTAAPSAADLSAILAFEQGLFTAQAVDNAAGSLSATGATGGPTALAALTYYPGINDSLNRDPTGARFNTNAMTLYTAWNNSSNAQQASIARGEVLFNTADMNLTNVPGLANVNRVACTFCHDAPNLGSRSLPGTMDTGVSHALAGEPDANVSGGLQTLTLPSLPLYRITGCTDATGAAVTYTTSDPGAALSTGLCADVNRTKTPILRGLAARAPFFHNGSAATLLQVVNFYDTRFRMGLSNGNKTDLVNFLQAL